MVQHPALAVAITEGEGTERFRKGLGEYCGPNPQESDFPFPAEYRGAYQQRRKECAMQLYASVGIAPGDRQASAQQTMKNFDLFGAPHVAIVTTDAALGVYGAVDCGLYVNTFLLAAQSLGVASIPQAALAGSAPYLRSFSTCPRTGRSCAPSRSATPTNPTQRTASATNPRRHRVRGHLGVPEAPAASNGPTSRRSSGRGPEAPRGCPACPSR